MGLTKFATNAGEMHLGPWIGKHLSLATIRRLAQRCGGILNVFPQIKMVSAIRANQWVISGQRANADERKKMSLEVCREHLTSLGEYFYYYYHRDELRTVMNVSPRIVEARDEISHNKRPTFLLGPHLGNFDLLGLFLAVLGLRPLVLSYPNPNASYKAQNKLREECGLDMQPLDFNAFRKAKKALKEGRCVVSGLDRVLPNAEEAKYKPRFFGHPAAVPVFYTRMALELGAVVRVISAIRQEDHSYYVDCSEAIEMEASDNLMEETLQNAEKVLQPAEQYILSAPRQWSMIHPVWPDLIPQ